MPKERNGFFHDEQKIIAVVLAAVTVLTFSGCGKNDTLPATPVSDAVNAAENNKTNDNAKLAPSEDAELAPYQFGTLCSELAMRPI